MYKKVKNALHLKPILCWYIYRPALLNSFVASRYNSSAVTDSFLISHSHSQTAEASIKSSWLQQYRAAVWRSYSWTQSTFPLDM